MSTGLTNLHDIALEIGISLYNSILLPYSSLLSLIATADAVAVAVAVAVAAVVIAAAVAIVVVAVVVLLGEMT